MLGTFEPSGVTITVRPMGSCVWQRLDRFPPKGPWFFRGSHATLRFMRYLTKFQLFTLLLAGAYILSPVDFIPEIIAGPFGLFDDAAAFAVIITMLVGARAKASTERNYQNYVRVDPETGQVF